MCVAVYCVHVHLRNSTALQPLLDTTMVNMSGRVCLVGIVVVMCASSAVARLSTQQAPLAVKFKYPQSHLYNVSDIAGCGAVLTTFDGVPAYSNGGDQGTGSCCAGNIATGCAYQCVELVQRYFHIKHGLAPIWPVAYAKQMCSSHPSGVRTTNYPRQGDAVVFNWAGSEYGHTAIVVSVADGVVNVVEQNASPTGRGTWKVAAVECYLSAVDSEVGESRTECSQLEAEISPSA